ncbi:MAG: hypothetical protein R3F40_15930 [Candidatus Competibacteraceae bacterium]
MQTRGCQSVKVRGVKVDHAGSRWRRRLKRNEIIAVVAAQQFLPAITQSNFNARIGGDAITFSNSAAP